MERQDKSSDVLTPFISITIGVAVIAISFGLFMKTFQDDSENIQTTDLVPVSYVSE